MIQAHPTKISVDPTKRPLDFSSFAVNNLAKIPKIDNLVLSITKSIVSNENKYVTFANILKDEIAGIEKQVSDILKAEYDIPNQLIHYNIDFKDIKDNQHFTTDFYNNKPFVYIAIIDVYIVS